MTHDVFISYSSKDKATADAVCHALEASGVRCWIAPRDIQPGADWGETIIHAISAVKVFVLVFSANANTSNQIKREVERAVNRGLPIIPFRIENVAPAASLEYFISTPHWLDAYTPPLEHHLAYLVDTVGHLLRGQPRPVPRPGPEKSRIPPAQFAYISALGALAVGLVAWQFAPPSQAGSFVSEKMEIAPERAQAVMQSQPLRALMIAAVTGPKAKAELRNDPDGFYQLSMAAEDSGKVRREGARLVFTSASGASEMVRVDAIDAVYAAQGEEVAPGDSGLKMEGELSYPLNWVGRRAESPGQQLPAAAVGDWRAREIYSPFTMASPWSGELSIRPSGDYVLKLRRTESGRYEAKDGRWRRAANFGGMAMPPGAFTDEGTYKWSGRSRLTLKNAEGVFTYRRVGPYRPLETNAARRG